MPSNACNESKSSAFFLENVHITVILKGRSVQEVQEVHEQSTFLR